MIVSEPLKTIFHIEVKSTCSKNAADSAAKMLKRGLNFIQGSILFPEEEKWKYVGMIYFGLDSQKYLIFCSACQKFVLGPTNDLWADLTKHIEEPAQANPSNETYLDALTFLLVEMNKKHGCCASTGQLIKKTRNTSDEMTTFENICFWSNADLNAIKNAKRIALTSEFGTGKTFLLKQKANEIIGIADKKSKGKTNQKITFVIFEKKDNINLLKLEYENELKTTGAKIVRIHGFDGKFFKMKFLFFAFLLFCVFV